MVPCAEGAMDWFCKIMRFAKVPAGILSMAMLLSPGGANGATVPGSYHVSLAWDAHIDPAVTGYRVHYGAVSGNYTSSIVVENGTTITIPGLASGIVYHFAITAINSSGSESGFSNQVSFLPGLDGTSIQLAPNGAVDLLVKGLIGQRYDIEATQDLRTWTIIRTITLGDGGSQKFTDPNAAAFPTRFYRTRKSP